MYFGADQPVVPVTTDLVTKVLDMNYGPMYVLLVGLALGTWWIIRYIFKTNEARELRYIEVIDSQARALERVNEIGSDIKEIKHAVMYGRKSGS